MEVNGEAVFQTYPRGVEATREYLRRRRLGSFRRTLVGLKPSERAVVRAAHTFQTYPRGVEAIRPGASAVG